MKQDDSHLLWTICFILGGAILYQIYRGLSRVQVFLILALVAVVFLIALLLAWEHLSKHGRARKKRLALVRELPPAIITKSPTSILMGADVDLSIPVYLPDHIRSRHVHILGATGSGKTEGVVLNFLSQDVKRGIGSIILDAKGDASFLQALKQMVPDRNLRVFDLSSPTSLTYDPLNAGLPLEAAQRLFSSLTWSEEYYKSKALSALQLLFEKHFERFDRNPTLLELNGYLESPKTFGAFVQSAEFPEKLAEKDFADLSGLRDQIRLLCTGHLASILSPEKGSDISLDKAAHNSVIYFRLQSLLSPQIVAIVGKLLINHLNYMAGSAHKEETAAEKQASLIPIYLDEFASFACREFADLISKARSAGFALHFAHQSIGDLAEVKQGFLNQITDNSATKIILRINDPDTADFFARSFGTKVYQKITQRATKTTDLDRAEIVGEGTLRDAHQFRASPDLFKTLPTGVGSVLIAHGEDTSHGASTVFKIRFPRLSSERG